MPTYLTRRIANFAGFLSCAALIGYALYAQYVLLLEPCSLCLFQRFAVLGLGVVFLLAALHNPKQFGAHVYASLLVLVALCGVFIAGWHIWIQAQPPGSVPSCGASLGYLFEIMSVVDVIKKVFSGSGECQHVDTLLGISWPWWTAVAMTGLGAWGALTNWRIAK
jgi:protein dithiol:quinone oxidoreductase